MTTVVITRDMLKKLECKYCGATVYRKIARKDGAVCKRCKQDNTNKNAREWRKRNGGSEVLTSLCDNCKYLEICRKEVKMIAVIPGEGIVIMPLRCDLDHPLYDPAEWGRNGVPAQD